MWKLTSVDEILPVALVGLTGVTGVVDAVGFLSLGHVFTANMTGNVVFLGFAIAGVPGISAARSLTALLAFLVGSVAEVEYWRRRAQMPFSLHSYFLDLEITFLGAAMFAAIGYQGGPSAFGDVRRCGGRRDSGQTLRLCSAFSRVGNDVGV